MVWPAASAGEEEGKPSTGRENLMSSPVEFSGMLATEPPEGSLDLSVAVW